MAEGLMSEDRPSAEPDRLAELDDEHLLAALGEVLRTSEPPPSWSVDLAKGSYDLLAIDAELAVLTSDSWLATRSAIRSAAAPRLAVFDAGDLSVEILIEPAARAGSWRLIGQLTPPAPARVGVRTPRAEPAWTGADDLGRFAVDDIPAGPLSLICTRDGMRPAVTQWIAVG
jgi:hypothetical protein